MEAKIYKLLQGIPGIPKLYWTGSEGNNHVMVMELLGPSLESILKKIGKPFSIPTLLNVAEQAVILRLIVIDIPCGGFS